jgi:hypothetical protein
MGGTFTIPEFNASYTITDRNLVRSGALWNSGGTSAEVKEEDEG